jgi:hypothetical protein
MAGLPLADPTLTRHVKISKSCSKKCKIIIKIFQEIYNLLLLLVVLKTKEAWEPGLNCKGMEKKGANCERITQKMTNLHKRERLEYWKNGTME